MKRLALKDPVTITGLSPKAMGPFPKPQTIVLRPLSLAETKKTKTECGWYWKTGDDTLVPIDMSLIREKGREKNEPPAAGLPALKEHPRLHYLYLQHGDQYLQCIEHFTALKVAVSLDGVVVEANEGTTWVPYDGRAKNLWESVQDHVTYDGHLTPSALKLEHAYKDIDPRFGWPRDVILDSRAAAKELTVRALTDYPKLGDEHIEERRLPADDPSAMADILFSRPLVRPWMEWLEVKLGLFSRLGSPHAGGVLRPSEYDPENPEPFKAEIARHRMLDLLGAAAFLAEAGTYLSGTLTTDKGSHATDIRFLGEVKTKARALYPNMECLAPLEPSLSASTRPFYRRAIPG